MNEQLNDVEHLYLAFGDKTRLQLLYLLRNGEVSVNSLTCTLPSFFFIELARKEPPKASKATAAVQSKAIVSLFLYVLRNSYAP